MTRFRWIGVMFPAVLVLGCGASFTKVEVVVTLDSVPVEGATVVLMPEDKTGETASGRTDSEGKTIVATSGKPGVKPGKYRALVTKSDRLDIGDGLNPTEAAKKVMEQNKSPGAAGPRMPPGMKKGPGSVVQIKQQLPKNYGSFEDTPFRTIHVPADGPVKLELLSK